jgi:hypothetical protein
VLLDHQDQVAHPDQVVSTVLLVLLDHQDQVAHPDQVEHQDQVVVLEIMVLIVESGDMIIHLLQHLVLVVLVVIVLMQYQ